MAITARRKLELSQLDPKALSTEGLGDDLDLKKFTLYLSRQIRVNLADRITAAEINRTIDGASTLIVAIDDYDRQILRAGLLNNRLDVQVDGLWFRLVKVEKDEANEIKLTFEDREIAILRTYQDKKLKHRPPTHQAKRERATRAEFVLSLIREVKEFNIPWSIPELHVVQDIEASEGLAAHKDTKKKGIPDDVNSTPPHDLPLGEYVPQTGGRPDDRAVGPRSTPPPTPSRQLTVKGSTATKKQIEYANRILTVGDELGANRKVQVSAIMTAIQESTLRNLPDIPGKEYDSAGLFQQRPSQGWGTYEQVTDPETAARSYILRAMKVDATDPTRPYWDLCQTVQGSAYPEAYAKHFIEANRIVTAYGTPGGDKETSAAGSNKQKEAFGSASSYLYYRGVPKDGGKTWEPENSWDCIQRLADEVNWVAFFVSGKFMYISEDRLMKSKPLATIREFMRGVQSISGDYDSGKKSATVEVNVRAGRWSVPPGSIVVLRDMGPWNGRWLVSEISRSLFKDDMIVILKKNRPKLAEPETNDVSQETGGFAVDPNTGQAVDQAQFGGLPNTNGSRKAVVQIAEKAYKTEQTWHYNYEKVRPYPDTLWSKSAHERGIDCSSFVTLVYKEAGAADPNNLGYSGDGNTRTLAAHGRWVVAPSPADLVFWGGDRTYPGHVGVYIGNGKVIEIGSDNGILRIASNYRADLVGYKSYLEGGEESTYLKGTAP
jgi:hypothetical protein